MIKIKVSTQSVIANFQKTLDLTQNFVPLFNVILGDGPSSQPWTIRGGTARLFASKTGPDGEAWQDLNQDYQKQKAKKHPGAPMLVATGELFRSVTGKESKGSVVVREPRRMVFGTSIEYAKYHMSGTANMPARRFLGTTEKQLESWKKLFTNYIRESMSGRQGSDPTKGVE